MHIICSNFGSIQPESKVAVWSTSAKPAMSCSQAGATIYGVPTSVHSDGISQHDWEVEGHVGIEDEVATMSHWHKLMSSPAQFKDAFTGEPLTNERCLYNCQELDRAQQLMQAGIHFF